MRTGLITCQSNIHAIYTRHTPDGQTQTDTVIQTQILSHIDTDIDIDIDFAMGTDETKRDLHHRCVAVLYNPLKHSMHGGVLQYQYAKGSE